MPTPGRDTRSFWACSSTETGSTAGPAEKLKMRSDFMNQQSISKFGLEPRRLRWHDFARIRHIHQLDDADRVHRKGDGHPAAVDELFERLCAFRTADEIYPLVGSHIPNAEDRFQKPLLQHVAVQCLDDGRSRHARALEIHRVPLSSYIHRHVPLFRGGRRT